MPAKFISVIAILFYISNVNAQNQHQSPVELTIKCDTGTYRSTTDMINVNGNYYLPFYFTENDQQLYFQLTIPSDSIIPLQLISSAEFIIVDSMLRTGNTYEGKIKFINLSKSEFLKLRFQGMQADTLKQEVFFVQFNLLPVHHTTISLNPIKDDTYVGEEKTFEIISNNSNNLRFSNEWVNTEAYDYRLAPENEKVLLHFVPKNTGNTMLSLFLLTRQPTRIINGLPQYVTDTIDVTFDVKQSRLQFLRVDKNDVNFDIENRSNGIDLVIENSRFLQLNKTYRISAQENPGGSLIAELFTQYALSNNKVLCRLYPYNLHKKSDGYLYIKDGDKALFITNFDITPKTTIEKIEMLRSGEKWKVSNVVYPGETVDVKITGKGLHKSDIYFEELKNVGSDTLIKNDTWLSFKLQVPTEISKKELAIFNHSQPTDKVLEVKEHHQPREFDFVTIDYGSLGRRLKGLKSPVIYNETVNDVVISFNNHIIDKGNEIYGIQHLNINIEITDKNNNLVEIKEIKGLVICPSERSVRGRYYQCINESPPELNLNDYIRKKTYDLDEWSRIKITVAHDKLKYNGEGYSKEFEIILKKSVKFDMDVSFPAGLLTISKSDVLDEQGMPTGKKEIDYSNLSGISMAMIAQFSFYHPDKIAKLRPYKVGAGFLAFNAFNFSENNNDRDVGIVVLGSVYPTTRDTKLTFPLYVGGGYFLSKEKWFFLIGPGIRVRL